jgi:hypothetical protein
MSILTFEPDIYKLQKQCSTISDFRQKIIQTYNIKKDNGLCQFWGCCQKCREDEDTCEYHEKMIVEIFTAKLMAFIINEPNMLNKIKAYISNEENIHLIKHLEELFDKDNEIYIGQHKKYGIRTNDEYGRHVNTDIVILVDDPISLFMSYIKMNKSWLISDSHLTDWLFKTDSDSITRNLTNIVSFYSMGVNVYYIKSLIKEDMIEIICHHVANEIYGAYVKEKVRVE